MYIFIEKGTKQDLPFVCKELCEAEKLKPTESVCKKSRICLWPGYKVCP